MAYADRCLYSARPYEDGESRYVVGLLCASREGVQIPLHVLDKDARRILCVRGSERQQPILAILLVV